MTQPDDLEFYDWELDDDDLVFGKTIRHPAVATSDGGGACPEQYEGRLTNGLMFYFRFRRGSAGLWLGTDDETVWSGAAGHARMAWGDRLLGMFARPDERDYVFAALLRQVQL